MDLFHQPVVRMTGEWQQLAAVAIVGRRRRVFWVQGSFKFLAVHSWTNCWYHSIQQTLGYCLEGSEIKYPCSKPTKQEF